MPKTLINILKNCPQNYQNLSIQGLSTDSRQVQTGDLFLAVQGLRQHGLDYAEQVVAKGAVAIGFEPSQNIALNTLKSNSTIPMFAIPNLSQQLGVIASHFYDCPSSAMTVIGVTGTNGKTSCSQWLAQALSGLPQAKSAVMGTLGNYVGTSGQVSGFTTPDAISLQGQLAQWRQQRVSHLAMEVSSHGLDQGRVNGVDFDIAVLTNLTQDHLDYHKTMQAYGFAKQRLFTMSSVKQVVLNADDKFSLQILLQLDDKVETISYGFKRLNTAKFIQVMAYQFSANGASFVIASSWGQAQVKTQLLGKINIYNSMAVLAVLLALRIDFKQAILMMKDLKPVIGRLELLTTKSGVSVVVDYAHTPDALKQVLTTLRQHCQGQLYCVFGCGGNRDKGKRPQMGAIATQLADKVIVTDDNPRWENSHDIIQDILQGITDMTKVMLEPDRKSAITFAIKSAQAQDLVLIAGKGHEDYQQVRDEKLAFSDRNVLSQL